MEQTLLKKEKEIDKKTRRRTGMSTRGFVGYKQNKRIKGWYNHYDSYPTGLGEMVFEKCLIHHVEELKSFFNRIEFVKEESAYDAHKQVFDMDWGFDRAVLQDGGKFYKDALFCEWSYLFDFDHRSLKVYKGGCGAPGRGIKDWKHVGFDGTTFYMNEVAEFDFERLRNCDPVLLSKNLELCVEQMEKKQDMQCIVSC